MKPKVHEIQKANIKFLSKKLFFIGLVLAFLIGCSATKSGIASDKKPISPKHRIHFELPMTIWSMK